MTDYRISMIAQAAAQIVGRLGPISEGLLVHALWTECAADRKDAKASIDLAMSDGLLVIDANDRFVLGPNAFVPTLE